MPVRHFFKIIRVYFCTRIILRNFASRTLNTKAMRGKLKLALLALTVIGCSKEGYSPERDLDFSYGRDLSHDRIVLGDRLENPYKTENITKALQSLYPTKADRVDVRTTDLYVRFLPADETQFRMLENLGLHLVDHPLDYEIAVEGDWYHDPSLPDEGTTWQYAVVPHDFTFPDVRYEIIDECHISENNAGTRADDGIDWQAVERQAYVITGNGDMLSEIQTKAGGKVVPSGRITIVDEDANDGKAFGVAGVRISCNSFVKFDHTYTDRDGYYTMNKSYSARLRYRLIFQNEKGFSLGVNLVLVPASVSTLGKTGPEGVNMTVTRESDDKLYRRCVVNNSAYDYYQRCSAEDLNLSMPPSDLRIWLLNGLDASSAIMLHHGAVLSNNLINSFLGSFSSLVKFFMPDITIGTKNLDTYNRIYSTVCHELAHSSHFTKVGTQYWNNYIYYIVESYLKTGGMTYGDGSGDRAGYCEIGEMWAYYMESLMYKGRYGGSFPTFGTSYWFYPQIFRYLDDRGISSREILSVLTENVKSKSELKAALLSAYPSYRNMIEQVFSRYGN